MKNFIKITAYTFLTLFSGNVAFGATCSSITRSNAAANSILTSTQYNLDLNTVYNFTNAFDGGCISSGTLEFDALNATQFATILNGIREGCKVTNTDSNTISVDRCLITVNGNSVRTAVATTVTWGCTSCSSETTSTEYYVYAKAASTGATLSLLISTTAPNGDGYDASSNKVLGRFFNNSSSNIQGVEQWSAGAFVSSRSMVRVNTSNGYGSSSNKIRRYTTIVTNFGPDITYADSSTLGGTFTINSDGIYALTVVDQGSSASNIGISLNSSQLTTAIQSITTADRLCIVESVSADNSGSCSWTGFLSAADVIRPHTDGTTGASTAQVTFTAVKVSP